MSLIKGFVAAAAGSLLAASAASAAPVTFDFRAGGNTGGNIAYVPTPFPPTPFVVDGIGIQANAGNYDGETETINTTNEPLRGLNKNNNGLGVCYPLCVGEIDGDPFFGDDLLTLIFHPRVRFSSVLFTEVSDGDDIVDVFVDETLAIKDYAIASGNPLDLSGLSGKTISFGANRATLNNLNEDDFRIGTITVAPVPLPAGLPLLVAALGGIALLRRTRRA